MPQIIRTLWGSETPVSRWIKLAKTDIPKTTVHSKAPHWVYVYGKENADLLTRYGHKNIVLVDPDPWPDGNQDCQRNKGNDFYRPWHYKWQLILRAMQDHGEIIYCDWDVFCMEPDIARVFSLLQDRPLDYTLALNCYMRPQRLPKRPDSNTRRFCVGGFWVHLRTSQFAEQVLERMSPDPAGMGWHDELVMSEMIDEFHGGWPGLEVWLQQYESPIMVSSSKRYPWNVVSDDGLYVMRETPIPFQWERVFRSR
jgi:hypothetical protein